MVDSPGAAFATTPPGSSAAPEVSGGVGNASVQTSGSATTEAFTTGHNAASQETVRSTDTSCSAYTHFTMHSKHRCKQRTNKPEMHMKTWYNMLHTLLSAGQWN